MPYYCTVPRCTSMAGKAKNVSFHQFPRDEELAKLWNKILKRGKPYTKYSKVCSLHFRSEDYTITSVGKNKGQWRTLRKDAIPTRNIPSDSPAPYRRNTPSGWTANTTQDNVMQCDPRVQVAQAIYMQTMLAMQAVGATEAISAVGNDNQPSPPHEETTTENGHPSYISQIEQLIKLENTETNDSNKNEHKSISYKCTKCSKCFKDPDVFLLHKRLHLKNVSVSKTHCGSEKENLERQNQETLKANPILANLLQSQESNIFDKNQLMAALAVNMENYMRMSVMRNDQDDQNCDIEDMESSKLVIDETV